MFQTLFQSASKLTAYETRIKARKKEQHRTLIVYIQYIPDVKQQEQISARSSWPTTRGIVSCYMSVHCL